MHTRCADWIAFRWRWGVWAAIAWWDLDEPTRSAAFDYRPFV